MPKVLDYQIIDGIKCYSPQSDKDYSNYIEGGHELTDERAIKSFWVSSRNRLFKHLVRINCVKNKSHVLEIGCATGDFIGYLSEYDDINIIGSEIYSSGLILAKRKFPHIDFIQYDVTDGVIDKKFDLITAFDVIEHIDADMDAINNIYCALNVGGIAIISVPQHQFLYGSIDRLVSHKRRYSKKELIFKLRAKGFKIKRATSFVFIPFPLMLISRLLDKKDDITISAAEALESRVVFPKIINYMLDCIMKIDEFLIRLGINLPFGGTLIVVAEK